MRGVIWKIVQYHLMVSIWPFVCTAAKNGVVLPVDPYIYIGNNITLNCTLTKYYAMYDSQSLSFFRHNDELISTKYISIESSWTIVLHYPVQSPADAGRYACKLNQATNKPLEIGSQYVEVEYEPKPVTEISCKVYNWQNMTCTWDLGVQFLNPKAINVTLIWAISDYQYDCVHQNKTSCMWKADDGLDSFKYGMYYSMGVSIVNIRNNETAQKFYPEKLKGIKVDTTMIVEPASVQDLIANKNSTCITLSWEDVKLKWQQVIYNVSFRLAIAQHWQSRNLDELRTLTLCDLQPNTYYIFSIRCRPKLPNSTIVGFWSQPTEITVLTLEDVPSSAPTVSPGSYVETLCHQPNCRNLLLYWQPLSTAEANGNITFYHIDYGNVRTQSHWENTNVSQQTHCRLTLSALEPYIIQIRAATSKGLSDKYSQVYVPISAQRPSIVSHRVEADVSAPETMATVYWENPSKFSSSYWHNLTSYTLFWCNGYKIEKSCLYPINSVEVPITARKYTLPVDMFETYMFGVAVNALATDGKLISSGFQWNTCIYIKNATSSVTPSNFRFLSYQPNRALAVEWDKLTCEKSNAYVHSYIISICPSLDGYSCSGKTYSFQVNESEDTFTMSDLEEGSHYKIWISSVSDGGQGPESEALFGVVIDRNLKAAEIGGTVIGSLFVLMISMFSIILCVRRIFTVVKQKYFVPPQIETPQIFPPLPQILQPMPLCQSSNSNSFDGIYEKIAESPPSPVSLTESTTGVEAPLIHSKCKLSLKEHIYRHKNERIHKSADSGQRNVSHSVDTLLMRLHLSHVKKHKKNKTVHKFGSDSGVIVDGRSHMCTCSQSSNSCLDDQDTSIYHFKETNSFHVIKGDDVNPYSCVDIVNKMETANDHLKRHGSEIIADMGITVKGSTLSLPSDLSKRSPFLSESLSCQGQSEAIELQFDYRERSTMKEAPDIGSSDIDYCYCDNSNGRNESATCDRKLESSLSTDDQALQMDSYIKFHKFNTFGNEINLLTLTESDCCCHNNNFVAVGDGYVTQNLIIKPTCETCDCLNSKLHVMKMSDAEMEKFKLL